MNKIQEHDKATLSQSAHFPTPVSCITFGESGSSEEIFMVAYFVKVEVGMN